MNRFDEIVPEYLVDKYGEEFIATEDLLANIDASLEEILADGELIPLYTKEPTIRN